MTGMLLSTGFVQAYGKQLDDIAKRSGITPNILRMPEGEQERLGLVDCERIEIAYLTRDLRHPRSNYEKFCDAMAAAKNLKWVHFATAGLDQHPFIPALIRRGVTLTTSAGTNSEPVAQTAIAGLLMLARRFPIWVEAQRNNTWRETRNTMIPPPDLRGQTVIVVGLGTIGTLIARVCHVLGMHVIGIRRTATRPDNALAEIHPPAQLAELLPRCQWLVIACPYSKDTHHLVNAELLAKLPHGATLINIARGSIVDESAVISALRNGQLGGAYLDVFEKEPLSAESPLWQMSNVILTPHIGAMSAGNDGRSAELFLSNVEKWSRGEIMPNQYRE